MMAEDTSNQWSSNEKALGLFRSTHATLFFGTPFRGIHNWFQDDLPELVGRINPKVQKGLFEAFREGSETLRELRQSFLNKCSEYKRPNVGCSWEMKTSNVGKIASDEEIPRVSR